MLDKYLHQSFKKIFFSRYIFFQCAVDVSEYMDQAFMVCIYFFTYSLIYFIFCELVRKDMDVTELERLSNITL